MALASVLSFSVLVDSKNFSLVKYLLLFTQYAAVNTSGQCVVVAGKTGLAHYALFTRKWKLFGNETQEHDMVVTGGLTWWKDFICTACYNIAEQRDEVVTFVVNDL